MISVIILSSILSLINIGAIKGVKYHHRQLSHTCNRTLLPYCTESGSETMSLAQEEMFCLNLFYTGRKYRLVIHLYLCRCTWPKVYQQNLYCL